MSIKLHEGKGGKGRWREKERGEGRKGRRDKKRRGGGEFIHNPSSVKFDNCAVKCSSM
jgi:hypothetical protein